MKSLSHHHRGGAGRFSSPSDTLTPTSSPSAANKYRSPRIAKENLDPSPAAPPPECSPFRHPSASKPLSAKNRSPLPPRPPSSNPLKRKLNLDPLPSSDPAAPSDYGVQVIVRMRPPSRDEECADDQIAQKISPTSVSILDHTFTFDSVVDAASSQQDVYLLMGLPLVENCLAGFNSSIFAYGQTGSGKTYTMWGPTSALQGDDLSGSERGLTPRVFEQLLSRINEEQAKHSDKQLKYQCRCSFLEIYNEQITDLLDPTQKNLQIREDVRTGVYVDYLTEENVCTMKDVTQLLIKGLANRRTGATSINAESSRSHCVFTCVVESRSKSTADGLSSLRTSRINLVDLAGSERQKLTGAAGDRLKEAGNINRSLSQLGNLINILAEVSQSGKQRHIPYRDSKLTFLLQESLGGNAKLAMICAISPSQSCKSETFSTLRFAQRAKAIKNKAVVNEVTQDDVNILREQIRQLKDELLRMKSNKMPAENNGSYSTVWNARRSLSLLRMSLNCPRVLLSVKDDSDEEMEIDENDVERHHTKAGVRPSYGEKLPHQSENSKESSSCFSDMVCAEMHPMDMSESRCGRDQVLGMIDGSEGCQFEKNAVGQVCPTSDIDNSAGKSPVDISLVPVTDEMVLDLQDNTLLIKRKSLEEKSYAFQDSVVGKASVDISFVSPSHDSSSLPSSLIPSSSLSILPCLPSPDLQSPTLSISPAVESYSRKSIRTSSSISASQNSTEHLKTQSGNLDNNALNASLVQANRNSLAPAERLAASLHHGLCVIESQPYSSALRRSSFRISMRPVDLMPLMPVSKVDVGIQTFLQESDTVVDLSAFICSSCKKKTTQHEYKDTCNDLDLHLVPIDGPHSSDKVKKLVPKAVEKVLAGAIRREMAFEDHCAKQAAEIAQLNRLVQQYKHERECNTIIEQTREDKIARLESLMDGILPTEEFIEEEFISLTNEHKLLKEKYENHPEVLRVNIELKRVQAELDGYRNFFDMGERDVLMEEIQDLRSQLQYYMDSSSMSTQKLVRIHKLTRSGEPPLSTISESSEESPDNSSEPISAPSTIPELTEQTAYEKFEEERHQWTETESKWICLSEELRVELEASRSLAEKLKRELDSEKKCADELKEALQTAMEGHARILEQYAELQEKHIALLGRHRQISDGIEDVKRAAAKAGVKGTESKFINSLAAEVSALRVERGKERQYWRDEKKGLQAQLRDTAEAVQAAGELLVRLKEAEETSEIAQKRVRLAEQETEKAYQEIDNLKKNYDRQIVVLNQFFAESRLPKEALRPETTDVAAAKYDDGESPSDQRWRDEFEPFSQGGDGEFSKGTEPYAWYSGYDRCNI